MRSSLRRAVFASYVTCAVGAIGCAMTGADGYAFIGTHTPHGYVDDTPMTVSWVERLTPTFGGPYVPVERGAPAVDPPRNRVYVGTSHGVLYAMTSWGKKLYRHKARGAIEARPAVDPDRNELYFGDDNGNLTALRASDGRLRWGRKLEGPVRRAPVLTKDAVYVVTETDVVMALARRDGQLLWAYRRELPEGLHVEGHAGLLLAGGALVTGTTDGLVVALDITDGRVIWERDTSLDLDEPEGEAPQFLDVDTTPVRIDDTVYAASFAAGVYALDVRSGTVLWRGAEYTGVTSMATHHDRLLLASADKGLLCMRSADHAVLWSKQPLAGGPGEPAVAAGYVLVGESLGGLVALDLSSGREMARVQAGHGFSAPPVIAGDRAFVLSNGGSLYALSL